MSISSTAIQRVLEEHKSQPFHRAAEKINAILNRPAQHDALAEMNGVHEWLAAQIGAHYHPANCVVPLSLYAKGIHPLLLPHISGPLLLDDRREYKKANVKAFIDQHKREPTAYALSVGLLVPDKPYAKAFISIIEAMGEHLTHIRMNADNTYKRDESRQFALASHELFWAHIPKTMRYISTTARTFHKSVDRETVERLIAHVGEQEQLEELCWFQPFDVRQLERCLDELPESLEALSFALPMTPFRGPAPSMAGYVRVLEEHAAPKRLKKLRIRHLEPAHYSEFEDLEVIQSMEQYALSCRPAGLDHDFVYFSWDYKKEQERQRVHAASRAPKQEDQAPFPLDTTKIYLDSRSRVDLETMQQILYEARDPSRPRTYPQVNLVTLNALAPDALAPLLRDGARCFPALKKLSLGFVEVGFISGAPKVSSKIDVGQSPAPWVGLGELSLEAHSGAQSETWQVAWRALQHIEEPLFPTLQAFSYITASRHAQPCISSIRKHMPVLERLKLHPVTDLRNFDQEAVALFKQLVEWSVLDHIEQLDLHLSPYMPSLHPDTPSFAYWLEQATNEQLPAFARRLILRMLFSKEVKKATLRRLYASAFGVKLPSSLKRDDMIARINASLPRDVQV